MSWFFPSLTWKNYWKNCARMCMRKARTTPPTPCPNAPLPHAWASGWPSSAIRKTTPRGGCLRPSARRRMSELRFLVVRLGSLGDIVHTFPAVAALAASLPGAQIVWLTHPRWVDLVASSGLAMEIWPLDSRDLGNVRAVVAKIRARSWNAAIDYQGLWKSALLPFFGGVRKRIGFSSETIREFGVSVLYTDRVRCAKRHIA